MITVTVEGGLDPEKFKGTSLNNYIFLGSLYPSLLEMQVFEFSPDACVSSNSSFENTTLPHVPCNKKGTDVHYENKNTTAEQTKAVSAIYTDIFDGQLQISNGLSNNNLSDAMKPVLEQHNSQLQISNHYDNLSNNDLKDSRKPVLCNGLSNSNLRDAMKPVLEQLNSQLQTSHPDNDTLREAMKPVIEQHDDEFHLNHLPEVSKNTNIENLFDQNWNSESFSSLDFSEIYVPLNLPHPTTHEVTDDLYELVSENNFYENYLALLLSYLALRLVKVNDLF